MLAIKNLTVSIGEKQILRDFTYTFESDQVYAIMGPNGSGKSTLAHTIMGNDSYKIDNGKLRIENEGKHTELNELAANERADSGIFLSFQSPLALQGIRVTQLLQLALKGKKSALQIRTEAKAIAKELHISEELLQRSLNEGASGGERKKMEVLQGAILDRPVQIYDEVDTGVDVDAMKAIGGYLHAHKKGKTIIVITHYNRILKYLRPDRVLVLKDGLLLAEGGSDLAESIEREGYQKFLVA
ncbi:MAG: Fe-S cluster assembly ATPase SufC [bacterium]